MTIGLLELVYYTKSKHKMCLTFHIIIIFIALLYEKNVCFKKIKFNHISFQYFYIHSEILNNNW